jgi:2-hydroxy-4-carboxymuconate semialdehyde hemiacetal dehydrogenase
VKIVLAGAGAFGQKHLDAIKLIGGIDVVSVVGREPEATRATAARYGIPHVTTSLLEALAQPGVEAAILCTPTHMHAAQAIECLQAGKHVQVEIPLADRWTDAETVARLQQETGRVCMVPTRPAPLPSKRMHCKGRDIRRWVSPWTCPSSC